MGCVRQVVVISGAPGSGKTTLAAPLATELGFPLLAKDVIKEALWDALDPPTELAESLRLGAAAWEVLWALAPHHPQVVLEANFRSDNAYERSRLVQLGGRLVEVRCTCPLDEAARRYVVRARGGERHRAHVLATLSPDILAAYGGAMDVGPVLCVDTTRRVDVPELADRVRSALAAGA